MTAITQIKILGLFDYDNDSIITKIAHYIDDIINKEFTIEIIPKEGVTFFRIVVNGEFSTYTARKIMDVTNSLIGNSNYEAVQFIIVKDGEEKKYSVDGCHDINI